MIKLYSFDELKPEEILNRDIRAEKNVEDVVDGIIADVRARGDEALKEYALKFDGAKLESLQVTQEEIEEAFAGMDGYFLETLREAAANIEAFHRQQVHKNFVMNDKPGIVLGQKYTPIEKAGVYVPGGTAAYPSTVLMDVIPAKVAGVSEIVMTTPAGKDGKVNPVILAAAATAGVTKIFKTGGAQAVAALAYGTQTIPAVDKIVGPGNIYVATAKRKVFGKVGIDMIAGPSEILVLADGGCDPAWVAADLLSQAEHDKLASPVLVTDSADLAKAVQAELEVQIPQLPRAAIARASVDDNGKIIVCSDLRKAIEACNIIAPEHLEVCIDDPFSVLNEIKNAGSIFLGRNVPEALGDYFAGPNHTLPTSGTARFSSPLGVDDFVKKSSFLYYTREALEKAAPRIADFAEREGLHAHARSVTIRYDKLKRDHYEPFSFSHAGSCHPLHPGGAAAGPAVHQAEHQRKPLPPLSGGGGGGERGRGGKAPPLLRPRLCRAAADGSGPLQFAARPDHARQRQRREPLLRPAGFLRRGASAGLCRHHLRLLRRLVRPDAHSQPHHPSEG